MNKTKYILGIVLIPFFVFLISETVMAQAKINIPAASPDKEGYDKVFLGWSDPEPAWQGGSKILSAAAALGEDTVQYAMYSYTKIEDKDKDKKDKDNGTPPPPSNGGGCTEEEPPADTTGDTTGGLPSVSPPSNGGYTPPVWTPPAGPPPTLPVTEPCMIDYFELPARAWVGYPITGRWSASAWCDDCNVDCTPYPECVWKQNNIGIGNIGANEYKFTLSKSGTYDYTLTCYGQGGTDERTKTATVEALNLPWWREIIPVLPGFLRGVWK